MDLIDVFAKKKIGDKIEVEGWIRNHRPQKEFGFIDFYDGTCLKSLQVVYDKEIKDFDEITHYHVGASLKVKGTLV